LIAATILSLLLKPFRSFCDDGMWLPMLLQETVFHDMQNEGLKLSPDDIYSVNHSSMKDAVLLFGSGCTGEVISCDGLLLTNHHCGLGQIQSHSSVDHDYVKNGFWAMNQSEELSCPAITVTFIIRMEDETSRVLSSIPKNVSRDRRDEIIDSVSRVISLEAVKGTPYGATVRSFYNGNQFFLIVSETFRDVRMVGAPPESIGQFGGDEDNWVWPRHNCDFSLFRIYANKDNEPADYSPYNVPYKPNYFFPISLKGVKEGDFTMVYGFPGRTTEYVSSYAVDFTQNISDPEKVAIRDARLKIWWSHMMANDTVHLKYSSKYFGLSNAWKKWQGEIHGLQKANAISKKANYETEFTTRINGNSEWKNEYSNLLPELKIYYDSLKSLQPVVDYYSEALLAPEIWKVGPILKPLIDSMQNKKSIDESVTKMIEKITKQLDGFYKNYDAKTDAEILPAMLELYGRNAGAELTPVELGDLIKKYGGDYGALSKYIFSASIFDNQKQLEDVLKDFKKGSEKKIMNDPAFKISIALNNYYSDFILPPYERVNDRIYDLNSDYMKAQMEVFPEKKFYPDANLTLRVAYGKVEGYEAKDAVHFKYYTTLDGVIEKYKPNDEFYDAPQKLIDLYHQKNFGRYADADGTLHTDFVASNHTTGGNSGSPVLDGNGNLIGINFDRCWEGTMSDLYFDPDQCRNISVDIRYVLFIIDKYAGAEYLENEMRLID